MKFSIGIFLLLLTADAFALSIPTGSVGSNLSQPFFHRDIQIQKEEISIQIDSSLQFADFEITYHLSKTEGIRGPILLFRP